MLHPSAVAAALGRPRGVLIDRVFQAALRVLSHRVLHLRESRLDGTTCPGFGGTELPLLHPAVDSRPSEPNRRGRARVWPHTALVLLASLRGSAGASPVLVVWRNSHTVVRGVKSEMASGSIGFQIWKIVSASLDFRESRIIAETFFCRNGRHRTFFLAQKRFSVTLDERPGFGRPTTFFWFGPASGTKIRRSKRFSRSLSWRTRRISKPDLPAIPS